MGDLSLCKVFAIISDSLLTQQVLQYKPVQLKCKMVIMQKNKKIKKPTFSCESGGAKSFRLFCRQSLSTLWVVNKTTLSNLNYPDGCKVRSCCCKCKAKEPADDFWQRWLHFWKLRQVGDVVWSFLSRVLSFLFFLFFLSWDGSLCYQNVFSCRGHCRWNPAVHIHPLPLLSALLWSWCWLGGENQANYSCSRWSSGGFLRKRDLGWSFCQNLITRFWSNSTFLLLQNKKSRHDAKGASVWSQNIKVWGV